MELVNASAGVCTIPMNASTQYSTEVTGRKHSELVHALARNGRLKE